MNYALSANVRAARDNRAPAPVLREDGSNYPLRMFFNNNQSILDADTPTECLDFLIPNYFVMTPEEKKEARFQLARDVQQLLRATILSRVDGTKVSDWEWDVLNYGDDTSFDPYGWGDGSKKIGENYDPEETDLWSSEYPLVLLPTSYAPYTEIARPISSEGDYEYVKNIIWLKHTDEEDLLKTLSLVGYITYGTPRATVQ